MKILVIQFARLGDIYMSWPAARALRRKYPEAEIHLLVRPRFEAATRGLDAVDRIVSFPTAQLLEPLVGATPETEEALRRTAAATDALRNENYDLIVNWTFSPLSSWLVKTIASPQAEVLGYNRHRDGSLLIADDVSAFFYAQVGTDRPNRVHLTDLFATMIDMDLIAEDWQAPRFEASERLLPNAYWVLHPGASETQKRVEPWQWARLIQEYAGFAGEEALPVVLIGSTEEKSIAQAIQGGVNRVPVLDLTGET
ncbi:MAG: glycosyltransferase family 9 protein [Bdellovibrionaceae bacterium]|nr:glycosyltransferase family 9 protein [Pseudobdellovibrionaceae bacterium]